jgi:hypothetical protein
MEYDEDKIDDAVLALLYLTLHDHYRAWKGHDWEALNRLYERDSLTIRETRPSRSPSPKRVWRDQQSCVSVSSQRKVDH